MKIRVLLADDHRILREGLRALLEREPDLAVVGAAENGREAVRLARELAPDVAVLDVAMPDLNGIDAARQILAENPGVKVIALSMHADKRFVAEMLRVGASGYLVKDCASDALAAAIRAVMAGQVYLGPAVAGVVVQDYVNKLSAAQRQDPPVLSGREREVVQLLAEGRSTREVAERLHVSVKTVETHRVNVMKKLGLTSLAELTKYAIREGLTAL